MNLATLDHMRRDDLLEHWRTLFKTPPPKGLSSPFLRRVIAFELQARMRGGLPKGFTRRLDQMLRGKQVSTCPALKPGGRLLREWNGITHVIDVTGDGFVWNGRSYRSLSAIAREITGARWSGPRFFGLARKAAG